MLEVLAIAREEWSRDARANEGLIRSTLVGNPAIPEIEIGTGGFASPLRSGFA